jgi:hypothetical protein
MLKDPIFRDNVATDKMVAMKGAERPYYASSSYLKLSRSIMKGFKKEGAVSAKWNKKLGKYEIFKGTHRLKASQQHGLKTLPLWDYTKVEGYDRKRCIAEGYKDNDLQAALNPMARCYAYIEYSKIAMKEKGTRKGSGRNPTHAVALVAQGMGDSFATVAHHMKFDEFPKSVKNLIGEGKLRVKQAVIASQLIGKVPEEEIEEFCKTASKQWWKPSRVAYEVKQKLLKKNVTHRVCYACKQRKLIDESVQMSLQGETVDMCQECYSGLMKTVMIFLQTRQKRTERLSELRSRFQLERSV